MTDRKFGVVGSKTKAEIEADKVLQSPTFYSKDKLIVPTDADVAYFNDREIGGVGEPGVGENSEAHNEVDPESVTGKGAFAEGKAGEMVIESESCLDDLYCHEVGEDYCVLSHYYLEGHYFDMNNAKVGDSFIYYGYGPYLIIKKENLENHKYKFWLDKKPEFSVNTSGRPDTGIFYLKRFKSASGDYSHAEGDSTKAEGLASHAEGESTKSLTTRSHAEGYETITGAWQNKLDHSIVFEDPHNSDYEFMDYNTTQHSEGVRTHAYGNVAHAEGLETEAGGDQSHAEGQSTKAEGLASHAEGHTTLASGNYSHTEGLQTEATVDCAHAGGYKSKATGNNSFAHGDQIESANDNQFAVGRFNANSDNALFEVGAGNAHDERKDALLINIIGTTWIKGVGDYDGTNPNENNSLQQVIKNTGVGKKGVGLNSEAHNEVDPKTVTGKGAFAEGKAGIKQKRETIIGSLSKSNENSRDVYFNNYMYTFLVVEPGKIQVNDILISEQNPNWQSKILEIKSCPIPDAIGGICFTLDTNISSSSIGGNYGYMSHRLESAIGNYSHTEGYLTLASGDYSHAEGESTQAIGQAAHAEGYGVKEKELLTMMGSAIFKKADNIFSIGTPINDLLVLAKENSKKIAIWDGNYISLWPNIDEKNCGHILELNEQTGYVTVDCEVPTVPSGLFVAVYDEKDIPNIAEGTGAHAEGIGAQASGAASHAEGKFTIASNDFTHAEGYNVSALGTYSHAEGWNTKTEFYGKGAHAEGQSTKAIGQAAHAEGESTQAIGFASHAEGSKCPQKENIIAHLGTGLITKIDEHTCEIEIRDNTRDYIENYVRPKSSNQTINNLEVFFSIYNQETLEHKNLPYGHVTRIVENTSSQKYTITVDFKIPDSWTYQSKVFTISPEVSNKASGLASHVEGQGTNANGDNSHAEGYQTISNGLAAHAEGVKSEAHGLSSHAEGGATIAHGDYSHAEGNYSRAYGDSSHAEGMLSPTESVFKGNSADMSLGSSLWDTRFAVARLGLGTFRSQLGATASWAHIEGRDNIACGQAAHAEGRTNKASGPYSHVEGTGNISEAWSAHAEGIDVMVTGTAAHGEGQNALVLGTAAHGEGIRTRATGEASHAEGYVSLSTDVLNQSKISNMGLSVQTFFSKIGGTNQGSHMEGKDNIAEGLASHAEGETNYAEGSYSHAEGTGTRAEGTASHAEGENTKAIGEASHAEGCNTIALNDYSHASGKYNFNTKNGLFEVGVGDGIGNWEGRRNALAILHDGSMYINGVGGYLGTGVGSRYGSQSLQEVLKDMRPVGKIGIGLNSEAHNNVDSKAVIGNFSYASGDAGRDDGIPAGTYSFLGSLTRIDSSNWVKFHQASLGIIENIKVGDSIVQDDKEWSILDKQIDSIHGTKFLLNSLSGISGGDYGWIPANNIFAATVGDSSHAEGNSTVARGQFSHAEGDNTIAAGQASHAEGHITNALGNYSHAEGSNTTAEGQASHAGGYTSTTIGNYSLVHGNNLKNAHYICTVLGQYNVSTIGTTQNSTSYDAANPLFVIGNGNSTTRANAFEIYGNGDYKTKGRYSGWSADYAEMFEWKDGNPKKEDRVGKFVSLDGEKIIISNSKTPIIGIVSGAPVIVGNDPMDWSKKYLTDEWNRVQYKNYETEEPEYNDNGEQIGTKIRIDNSMAVNPDYDPEQIYIPRTQRPEWSSIGLLGQLLVRQDGSIKKAGCYCSSNDEGIATKSTSGYYVMKVVNKNQVLVLLK